jgi:hypothetical protein
MPKLTNLKSTDSKVAWCPSCKDEFITYNMALAKCPRCGGMARAGIRGLAVKGLILLVIAAVIGLVGVGAYMVLKSRGIIDGGAGGARAEEPAPEDGATTD